jgi:type III pantothenate kinase
MIYTPAPYDADAPVVVIDIGNSSIGVGTWSKDELLTPTSVATEDTIAIHEALIANVEAMPTGHAAAVVIASVVPEALDRIREYVETSMERIPLVIGEKLPLPIDVAVDEVHAIGVDRVCAAAAAFEKIETACTVIDFGTATTIDLVDGDGKLVGGSILPGVKMQLRALHEQTAALPLVEPGIPETPFGRNTTEAIQNGVCRGIAGAARAIVEAYSAHLNHWPHVVATGGDLEWLLPHCDFIDTPVRDLALRGVGVAYAKYLAAMGA